MSGVLQWMATSSLERKARKEGQWRGSLRECFDAVDVVLVRECFDVVEFAAVDDKVESLWVSIRGRASKADILMGFCYRPPNQNKEIDEVFYEQLAEVV